MSDIVAMTPVINQISPRFDFIYNTTLLCQWDCEYCCVDAIQIKKAEGHILLRQNGLLSFEKFRVRNKNVYQQASDILTARGRELDLGGKKRIIDNIKNFNSKIDISGGDALLIPNNIEFLHYASSELGSENVTLTATGTGSGHVSAQEIAPYIGEYNFTYDSGDFVEAKFRPNGYAIGNLKRAIAFQKLGKKTRAEIPLTSKSCGDKELKALYFELHKNKIDVLLVMRLFPVGRGVLSDKKIPSNQQYIEAIETLQSEERVYGYPRVDIQCALRFLVKRDRLLSNPCDLFQKSFGIMPDGTLLLSPWAYGLNGNPIDENWVVGNIAESSLKEILDEAKKNPAFGRLDDNFGHCKVFAYLKSRKVSFFDRLVDSSDPLFV